MARRSLRLILVLLCVAAPFSAAQTLTVPDGAGDGGSVVEVVTTDIDGLPVTNIINTIPAGGVATTPAVPANPTLPSTTRTTATRVTPTPPDNQGPLPQPAPTVPVGQGLTTYQYTTVDSLGQTTVIQDTFTPTYNTPSPPSSPSHGTVLSPSDYSALIGTHTVGGPTSGVTSWRLTAAGGGAAAMLMCSVVVGALTLL